MNQFVETFLNWQIIISTLPTLISEGLYNTMLISVFAIAIGLVLGTILALLSISSHKWLSWPARAYVDVFRGVPEILIIFAIGFGLPIAGLDIFGLNKQPYGIAALGLITTAYICEILRAGIQGIDKGQLEAGRSLGLTYLKTMRLVIIPQAIRRMLPAFTNQFVSTIKLSSLVWYAGITLGSRDLFSIGNGSAQVNGNMSPLMAAGLLYLLVTIPLTHLVNHMDARGRRGTAAIAEASLELISKGQR